MDAATLAGYDQVPYNSSAFRLTHPSHLATIATLFGMQSPSVRHCRVLELGCASGGNLIPMAEGLPEGEFLGIDLSSRQIADGRSQLAQLTLRNVELRHQSILDITPAWGQFDYIVCHGVYSWVPAEVRDKILEIGRDNLQPQGILYVSYNTYPGWHMRGVVRDMMRYHVAPFDDPQTKIAQSRALLSFLTQEARGGSGAYSHVLQDESQIVGAHADSYLFHEHLEEENQPLYFHEFIERAESKGLQYLGETEFATMLTQNLGTEAAAILRDISLVRQEQYMDFLRNRMFRATLLCHADTALDRSVDPARLMAMHVGLEHQLDIPEFDLRTNEPVRTEAPSGETLTLYAPITKAAIQLLSQSWPQLFPFELLEKTARSSLSAAGHTAEADVQQRARLTEDLMALLSRSLVRVLVDPPGFTVQPGERPLATPLARWQAARQDVVTTRRHEQVRLPKLAQLLLQRCDGVHDLPSLEQEVRAAAQRREVLVHRDDQLLEVEELDEATVSEILTGTLDVLARSALLIA